MKRSAHRDALTQAWESAFGHPLPRYVQAQLVEHAVGWHRQMQENLLWRGSSGRRRLRRLLQGDNRTELTPGMMLVREWQGEVYHVLVLPEGFELNGRVFKSLSAIARHITGTAWSGPLFFGVDL